jgi:spore germination cell wall hydrolase CwlJ-like protein
VRRISVVLIACLWVVWPFGGAGASTAEDIRVMALNMYHEARGEGRLGMLAVGWVVLNRMADAAYPATVRGVVYQGCQFSWVCDGRSDRPRDAKAWRRALQTATDLLERPGQDPTRGAMWYHASWVRNPGFGPRVARIGRIGRHVFYTRVERAPDPQRSPRLLFASR